MTVHILYNLNSGDFDVLKNISVWEKGALHLANS